MLTKIWKRLTLKQSPSVYENKDSALVPNLSLWNLLALGLGMVVGTGIFTLPGIVGATHTGPAVCLSVMVAVFVAFLDALAYAETASALPFAGSAFSWMNVLFGEFVGWIVGWALLAEYFLAMAFVASGWSAFMQEFLGSFNIYLPKALSSGFNPQTGGVFDLFAAIAILLVGFLLSMGDSKVSKVENVLTFLKLAVVILVIAVGATAIKSKNLVPFVPAHKPGTSFGGIPGVWAGASQIMVAFLGFDAIAANTAETKNAKKNMPLGLIGTLLIGGILFALMSLVIVGMFKYTVYANNAAPAAWALKKTGHFLVSNILSVVAIVGMFASLIGTMMASSRLVYSFGRDGLMPKSLGKVNKKHLPNHALWTITIAGIFVGALLPFQFLSNLVSGGTLLAFIVVSLGIYALRPREGVDIGMPKFKMPLYPILPSVSAILSFLIFWGLSGDAKLMMIGWFIIGILIYFFYGVRHSNVVEANK